jgi:nucleoside-diphosphate-sugar epimerase
LDIKVAKILVTGGLGFIGHNVVALLEQQGNEVVIVDNMTDYGIIPRSELNWLFQERQRRIRTTCIYNYEITWSGMSDIMQKHGIEIVVHLAAFPRQKVVNANPALGSRVMSEGLLNLLEASIKNNVRKFVYVSSSMVYGNFNDQYHEGVDENHPTHPIGQYGIMKLAGEWLVRDYQRRTNLAYTIIRPSAVYGPYDVEDRVVSKFLLTAMRGGVIQVNGGNELLDFTFVSDAASGIASAATSEYTDNMTYNITRGQSRSLLDAAKLAVEIVGQGTIQINDPDGNFPTRGQLNITRAYNDFGFIPEVDIEQGFEEYYEWLKNSFYGIKKAV